MTSFHAELETDPIFQSEAREAAMLNDTFSLEDFRYDNNVVLRNIMKYVANTTFNGVTVSSYVTYLYTVIHACTLLIWCLLPHVSNVVSSTMRLQRRLLDL